MDVFPEAPNVAIKTDGPPQSASPLGRPNRFQFILLSIIVCLVCYLTSELRGLLEIHVPQPVWRLWPGCALLAAVLLLVPRRLWPALIAVGIAGFVAYDLRVGLPRFAFFRWCSLIPQRCSRQPLVLRSYFRGPCNSRAALTC